MLCFAEENTHSERKLLRCSTTNILTYLLYIVQRIFENTREGATRFHVLRIRALNKAAVVCSIVILDKLMSAATGIDRRPECD